MRKGVQISYRPEDPSSFSPEYQEHLGRVGADVQEVMDVVAVIFRDDGVDTILSPKGGDVEKALQTHQLQAAVADVQKIISQDRMSVKMVDIL